MSTDIATLGIEIESTGVASAVRRLDELTRSATTSHRATDNLSKRFSYLESATNQCQQTLKRTTSGVADWVVAASNASQSTIDFSQNVSILGSALVDLRSHINAAISLIASYAAATKAIDFGRRGVQFNTAMEQSVIGIGSLITSMATLSTAQDKVLEGQEKYNAAQVLAKNLMKDIQILGLETTATTTELVGGVQSMMSSALAAGFTLKQIPQFAVAAAQAMQTMGVPLEQMRTELDALLTGQINSGDDILAQRLFGDIKAQGKNIGEYIRNLRSAGKLYDELMRRLEAFRLAGADVANTLTGLMSNVEEALDVIAGQATKNLTNSIKTSVKMFQELFFTTKDGTTAISSDFQNIASVMEQVYDIAGEKLLQVVTSIIDGIKSVNSALQGADIRDLLSTLVPLTGAVAAGFITMKSATAVYSAATKQATASNVKQLGVLQAVQFQLGAIQLRASAAGAALLSAFGGPIGAAIFAIGSAIGYLATAETSAEQVATRHALSLDMVSSSTDAAAAATRNYTNSLNDMSTQQAKMEVQSLTAQMNEFINGKWFESNLAGRIRSSLSNLFPSADEFEELSNLTEKLLPSNLKNVTAKQLQDLKQQFEQFAIDRDKSLEFKSEGGAGQLLDYLILLVTKLELARDRVNEVSNESANAAPLVDELTAAVNLLNNTQDANVGTLQGAITFLQKYTKATDSAKKSAQENAAAQAQQALKTLQAGAAAALAAGETEKAAKLNKALDDMKKAVKEADQMAASGGKRKGSGGLDQITRTEESLRKLRMEVQHLREVETSGAKGYAALVLSIEQGRQAALADAQAQYDLTLKRKSATAAQAEQILALQKEKIELETTAKLRDAEKQKLQTTADLHERLASLTYDDSIAREYRVKLIQQEADELRRANPELEQYISTWEKLSISQVSEKDSIWLTLTRTTDRYFSQATDWASQFGRTWDNAMGSMADGLTEFCMSSSASFNDMINGMIKDIVRLQMQAALSGLFKGVTTLVSGLFEGTTTSSVVSEGVSYETGQGWHTGGVVGHDSPTFIRKLPSFAFADAPRLHDGGGWFRSDEYPAILQKGERVLNRSETAAYNAGQNSRSKTTPQINVPVNVIFENGSRNGITAEKVDQRPNSQGGLDVRVLIKDVIVSDVAQGNGGRIAKTFQSVYGLKRQTRGR